MFRNISSLLVLAALSPVLLFSRAALADVFVVGDDAIGKYATYVPPAPACGAQKTEEVFAPASAKSNSVTLDCSLDIPAGSPAITKTLVIEGSAANKVLVDCNFGELSPTFDFAGLGRNAVVIRSKKVSAAVWDAPHGVTVRNCEVRGRIRVMGVTNQYDLSRKYGNEFTAIAQRNAPSGIVLDTLDFEPAINGGDDRGPDYFFPGVTYSSLINSSINGTRSTPSVYLDAETGHNLIKNNHFQAGPINREVIAVDGSAYNRIVDNYFSGLNQGGIYIYRNCGQDGTVRIQQPRHNQIINNVFYYNKFDGDRPAIWIGQRDDDSSGFCNEDNGFPFGSSADNHDFAHDNLVAQNRFFKFQQSEIVRVADSYMYFSAWNEGNSSDKSPRPAGCYVETSSARIFLKDGESTAALSTATTGRRYLCRDNTLRASGLLTATTTDFSCQREGNDAGCVANASCPAGAIQVGVRATCNLENPSYRGNPAALAWSTIKVEQPSDNVSDGACGITGTTVNVSSGTVDGSSVMNSGSSSTAYCREHDKNGGDCSIQGQLLCL